MKNKIITSILLLLLVSCNKDRFYSKRLMKGETWTVQSIKINDTLSNISGSWKITQGVNIYDSVPQAVWKQRDYNSTNVVYFDAVFQWQFHEKAKKFYINYQVLCEECEPNTLDTLDYFANALSGEYNVLERSRKTMQFESKSTLGFSGKTVRIELTKK
ncbi:MAG: hypothetical protein RL264_1582 [Bacteroidota bacterium]